MFVYFSYPNSEIKQLDYKPGSVIHTLRHEVSVIYPVHTSLCASSVLPSTELSGEQP